MIKKSILKKVSILFFSILVIVVINIYPNKETKIKFVNKATGNLYLLDNNNYVSRVDFVYMNNNTLGLIKEIINILTINSEYQIRDGFSKVIPENTKLLNVIITDKTATLNFSKELLNVSEKLESKMIEAIVFSLTDLEEIDNVIIKIENLRLTNLPHSKKVLPELLNRSIKINKEYDLTSLDNIFYTTVFYVGNINGYKYYIPVSKYTNNPEDHIKVIISELKTHSTFNTNIIDYINDLEVSSYNILDEALIINLTSLNNSLSESIMYALNLSIKENYSQPCIYYLNNHLLLG